MVHVDDLLVTSATKRDEEQGMENDMRSSFHIKDLGGGGGVQGSTSDATSRETAQPGC